MSAFALDVRQGLLRSDQKRLSPEYFYDAVGSALFEAITCLDEYGLTRADARLLAAHAGEMAALAGWPPLVFEMGSGSGRKTSHVLGALKEEQPALRYFPIDVSQAALDRCRAELEGICPVRTICARFLEGLRQASDSRSERQRAMAMLLGSTIGNFDRSEAGAFLSGVRAALRMGDTLLIGFDLVKDEAVLLAAYDDPAGVTAAFNLNLLARMNRELGADFDLRLWRHVARYDASRQRVEMHLESRRVQTVVIPRADCGVRFRRGETIWTESSHKYTHADLALMACRAGFRPVESWTDAEWPFAECLWAAA